MGVWLSLYLPTMDRHLLLLTTIAALAASQCVLTPNPSNVVSTQLAGNWTLDIELTGRIWPSVLDDLPDQDFIMMFEDLPEVLEILPEEDCAWFAELPIYMAGMYNYNFANGGKRTWHASPFVLTDLDGNPHIVYWWKEMTDTESFNVMMARAEDHGKDLLLMGGDFNNQPFPAWSRM